MTSLKNTLISLACALAATAASAATVKITFDNNIFQDSGADIATITFANPASTTGWTSERVYAGRFQGTASELSPGINPSNFPYGLNDVYMYCYDVFEDVGNGWVKTYQVNFGGATANTLDFLGAVNSVMNAGKSVYDPYAWLRPVNQYQGAAIQIGIWESQFDTDWNLSTGKFKAAGQSAQTTSYWNSFQAAIPTTNSLEAKYVMTLTAQGIQDMITGDPPTEVPEPGSLTLIGVALVALAATRRKQAR